MGDNKTLLRLQTEDPHFSYHRLEAQHFDGFDAELRAVSASYMAKYRRKMQKKSPPKHSNAKASEKEEMDEEEKGKEKKRVSVSLSERVSIIEAALSACCRQLIHYNKLFLQPIPEKADEKEKEKRNAKEAAALAVREEKKKARLRDIKERIEEKRQCLVQRIHTLRTLRQKCHGVEVELPPKLRAQMEQREQKERERESEEKGVDLEKSARTERVVSMVRENKKRKMLDLEAQTHRLKENEERLRREEKEIAEEEKALREFIELKRQNELNDTMNDTLMTIPSSLSNSRKHSMTSSISSTIHGHISPSLFEKFNQSEKDKNTLSWDMLIKRHNALGNWADL